MLKIKLLVFTILICIGLVFNGELYLLYMNNFQAAYYEADFYTDDLMPETSEEEIKQDFLNASKEHKVDFFVVDGKKRSVINSEYVIYGTEGALSYLTNSGIKEGNAKSFFFGEVTVKFKYYSDVTDIGKYTSYYFIDDNNLIDIRNFKADLIDQYGGGFPKQMGSDRETIFNLLAAWSIILGLMILISLYEILYQKKEIAIKVVLGEDLRNIFLKKIISDSISYCLIFCICTVILKNYSYVLFKFSFVLLIFGIFLLINLFLSTLIFIVNFRKHLTLSSGKGLLSTSYCIKALATILVVFVLTTNTSVIQKSLNLYAQKSFFENHLEYEYIVLSYMEKNKTAEDILELNKRLYQQFQDKALIYADLSANLDSTYPIILTNQNTLYELAKNNEELKEIITSGINKTTLLFIPSDFDVKSNEYFYGTEIARIFGNAQSIDTIFYKSEIKSPGIHGVDEYQLTLYSNPIIVCNFAPLSDKEFDNYDNGYYYRDIMYKLSEKDWSEFLKKYPSGSIHIAKSNVKDVYEHCRELASLEMKLVLVLSGLILMLEMALIVFIIRMEYRFNAIELALKKVNGYSLISRNKTIIKTTIFSLIAGIAGAWIIGYLINGQHNLSIFIVSIILIITEIFYILCKARKIESKQITLILKGGRV